MTNRLYGSDKQFFLPFLRQVWEDRIDMVKDAMLETRNQQRMMDRCTLNRIATGVVRMLKEGQEALGTKITEVETVWVKPYAFANDLDVEILCTLPLEDLIDFEEDRVSEGFEGIIACDSRRYICHIRKKRMWEIEEALEPSPHHLNKEEWQPFYVNFTLTVSSEWDEETLNIMRESGRISTQVSTYETLICSVS